MSAKSARKGEGGLYKRGSTYYGRVKIGGIEHRSSLRATNEREAKAVLKEWVGGLADKPASANTGGPTWKEAVVRWSEEFLGAGNVSSSTALRYLVSLRAVNDRFSGLTLAEIDKVVIADYVSSRLGNASNATIRRDLTAIGSVFEAADVWGWASHNPARAYERKRMLKLPTQVYLPPTRAEVATLLSYAPDGMRQSSSCSTNRV